MPCTPKFPTEGRGSCACLVQLPAQLAAKGCCGSTGDKTANIKVLLSGAIASRGRVPSRFSQGEKPSPGQSHWQSAPPQQAPFRVNSRTLFLPSFFIYLFPPFLALALQVSPHRAGSYGMRHKHMSKPNVCPREDVAIVALCSALCSDYQTNTVSYAFQSVLWHLFQCVLRLVSEGDLRQ